MKKIYVVKVKEIAEVHYYYETESVEEAIKMHESGECMHIEPEIVEQHEDEFIGVEEYEEG